MGTNMVRNPGKRTAGRRRALIAALRRGHGFASAAIACKLSVSFFRQWRHDDAEFRAECADATDFRDDIAEHALYDRGVNGGDTLALLAWLRAHRPELYHRKMLVALGGDENAPPIATTQVERGAWIYPRAELLRAIEQTTDDPVRLAETAGDLDRRTVHDAVIEGEVLDAEDAA
jgi:hypothetical protein